MSRPIRILVVDDSAVFRMVLSRVIDRAVGMEVVGIAANGREALAAVRELEPDVVTLDVEMPVLDGLATLRQLLADRPTAVVMLSRATTTGAEVTMDALRAGAVDAIAKPDKPWGSGPNPFVDDLLAKIRAAALVPRARLVPIGSVAGASRQTGPRDGRPGDVAAGLGQGLRHGERGSGSRASALVVVATSTGGPRALDVLLGGLPADLEAGVVVVQHMLTGFTASLAGRLDQVGPLTVTEASAGMQLVEGLVVIAPGDRHVVVSGLGRIELEDSPPLHRVRPAADVTLIAAAPVWGARLLTVVLTGMGRDGADGAAAARIHGGSVIAQDEPTSAVYGMPRAIADAGLADRILPLEEIAPAIAEWARARREPPRVQAGGAGLRKLAAVTDT